MTAEHVHDLMRRANTMPFGAAKTAVVEEAVRHADAAGDVDLAFATRMELVNAYQYGAEPGKSFVPFSWCLAAYDADPKRHAEYTHTLLWYFKYMISNLTRFPEIPLDRTYAVLDDMERRWRDGGHSPHAVHRYRESIAAHVGDEATEVEQFRLWSAAPRDELSDCVGCDPTGKVRHLTRHRRYDEAVAVALPVLQGRMTCREQPQQVLTSLLRAYVHTGRHEEAADAHRRAYRVMRADRGELESIGDHVLFCALTGNEVRALELVERHVTWLDNAPSPYAQMWFATAAGAALRRVDPELPIRRRRETKAGELAAELAERATELAARFDARNGTAKQSELVATTLATEPWCEYLPLSETARRAAQLRATRAPHGPTDRTDGAREERAARRRNGQPVVAEPTPTVDPALTGDALLDHAEERWRRRDEAGAKAAWAAFAERVPAAERTPLQAARLLDAHGLMAAVGNAPDAALAAWREALTAYAALDDDHRVLRVRGRLGTLLCQLGDVDEGLATGEEPLRRLFAESEPGARAPWALSLAAMLLTADRPTDAYEVLTEAAPLAGVADSPGVPTELRLLRASALLALEHAGAAETELRAVREAADASDHHRAYAAFRLGELLLNREDVDGAVDAYSTVIALGDGPMAAEARLHRGRLLVAGPRAAEAVPDLVEAVAEFTLLGLVEPAAFARIELAVAYLSNDRPHEAAESAEEAVAALPGTAAEAELPRARHVLATAYRQLGELEPALEQIRATLAELPDDDAYQVARIREEEGDLLEAADRDGEAVAVFESAAQGYATVESPLDRVRALRKAARSARYADRLDQAARLIESAETVLVPLPSGEPAVGFHAAGIHYDRAQLAERAGRRTEAAALAGQAAEGYDRIGAADNAADARLTQATLLDPPAAEPVLRAVFEAVEHESQLWYRAGYALVDALREQGREPEASELAAKLQ